MKMTRKLIPALVMLIVSAIMLSTASFAWFANNTTVTATSMTVKANTDVKFLQITDETKTAWGKTANAKNESALDLNLVHAHIADGKTVSWWKGEADDPASPTANGALTGVAESEISTGKYALVNTFYVKMSNTAQLTNLTISGVVVTGESNLKSALRVLVVAYDEDTILGAQLWNANANTLIQDAVNNIDSASALADTVTNEEIKLSVYVFYDGEDSSAYTDNTGAVANQTVSISFSAS